MADSSSTAYEADGASGSPPPWLPGAPLVGSLFDFMGDPVALFRRGYRTLGPAYRVRVLHRTFVVLAGAEAMRLLAREETRLFAMNPIYHGLDSLMGASRSIISADGALHADLRKRAKPAMSRTYIEKRLPRVVECTKERLARYEGREVPLISLCRDLVFHQLSTLMGGLDAEEYRSDIERTLHTSLEVAVTQRWPRFMAYDPRFLRARRRVIELAHRILREAREAAPGDPRFPEDGLFPILERALRDGVLEKNDVPLLALTPYLAGVDTVASSLAFLVAAVFRDRALTGRLRDEANEAFANNAPGPAWLSSMPRIDAAKTEGLRRYPVTVASIRRCIESFAFDGRAVSAGTDVLFPISLGLLLEENYPDPLRFDPERFFGEGAAKRIPFAFTPFGAGAHTCLGAALAETQLVASLAVLLERADVTLSNGGKPIEVVQDPFPVPKGERVLLRRVA
jgi:cytochrome P450